MWNPTLQHLTQPHARVVATKDKRSQPSGDDRTLGLAIECQKDDLNGFLRKVRLSFVGGEVESLPLASNHGGRVLGNTRGSIRDEYPENR